MAFLTSLWDKIKKTPPALFIKGLGLGTGIIEPEPVFRAEVGEGLSEEQKKEAEEKLKIRQPTPIELDEIVKETNYETLSADIDNFIDIQIKAGFTDVDKILRNTENFIDRKINEKILKKIVPPPEPSIGKFKDNFSTNLQEISQGIGAMLGLGLKAPFQIPEKEIKIAGHPIYGFPKMLTDITGFTQKMIASPEYRQEVYRNYIKPGIIDEYAEYRNPVKKFYNEPVDVILDVTALFSLGAFALGKFGAKFGLTWAANAGARMRNISQFGKLENLSKETKFLIKQLPDGDEVVKNLELTSQTRKFLAKEQAQFLTERAKILQEIDNTIKGLSKEELKAIPLTIEGFQTIPENASPQFLKASALFKSLADDQARFGLNIGALTPETIERRKWLPLNRFLEKEGQIKLHPEIKKAKDLLEKAKTSAEKTKAVNLLKKAEAEHGYISLTGDQLRARINLIKKQFPDADPIYMMHVFDDDPVKFSIFFQNTQPVRSFKPSFLKRSFGASGYIGAKDTAVTAKQLRKLLERQSLETLKWKRNIQLIENLTKHPEVKPLKRGEQLLPGYKAFTPDGMIRFYRGTIDLAEELKKSTTGLKPNDEIWSQFEDAVKAFSVKHKKTYVGVGKAKVYQAPEAMANELSKLVKSSNPYVKIFYDKPLDAFRFAVLALFPRWNMNNLIGNTIFSIVDGNVLTPKKWQLYKQARSQDLFPDELFGGVHRVERTTAGKIGSAADRIPLVKSTVGMHDAMLDARVIGTLFRNAEKGVKKGVFEPLTKLGNASFRMNLAVDDLFKGTAYVKRALIADRKSYLQRMLASFEDVEKSLKKVRENPKLMEQIVNDVHQWYYHGLGLTNFERRAVRRAIPFYSWMRWMTLYSYRIATEAPIRADIIAKFARDFYMFTGQNKLDEYLRGSVPVSTLKDGTVLYLNTRGANPFQTLNDLMSEGVIETALQGSAPGVKTFMEQATGREVFLGRPFTTQDIEKLVAGRLYRFDPETGKTVEVPDTIKPGLLENALRNYIPQYLLMETILTQGKPRYTENNLIDILKDLNVPSQERKTIVKDILGFQKEQFTTPTREILKTIGINIKEVTPEDVIKREIAKQKATSAILNQELPLLHPQIDSLLGERIDNQIIKLRKEGKSEKEIIKIIEEDLQVWIGQNLERLQRLFTPQTQP